MSEPKPPSSLDARRFERAQALASIGAWELDLETGEGWWSDQNFKCFGVEPGSLTPT